MGFRDRLLLGLVAALGPTAVRLLGATWTVRLLNEGVVDSIHAEGRQVIYAFWHCNILPLGFTHRGSGVVVLSSWHRDGEISTRLMEALGFAVERGSTTRGSVRGLVKMVGRARGGRDLAMTPDGPRGPARVAQTGTAFLSQKALCPIVPLGVGVNRCRRLSSWDRFVIPYPFARVVVLHGDPIDVGREADIEAVTALLAEELERLGERAQALADGSADRGSERGGG